MKTIVDDKNKVMTGKVTAMVSRSVIICNKMGLHARPAMQFVDIANQYTCNVTVRRFGDDPTTVDGKSIMEMLTLAAVEGTELQIDADGEDAEKAVVELANLIETRFGEDE